MKNVKWQIIVTGIVCITALEAIALLKGINGTLLTVIVAAIAAMVGVAIPTPKVLK